MSKKRVKVSEKVDQVVTEAVPVVTKSNADKFWDEIKNVKLQMFALPDQFVNVYYRPINVNPDKLYLLALTKASSALSSLEESLAPKYVVEQVDRFTVISLASDRK